jgi:hypothetical protein
MRDHRIPQRPGLTRAFLAATFCKLVAVNQRTFLTGSLSSAYAGSNSCDGLICQPDPEPVRHLLVALGEWGAAEVQGAPESSLDLLIERAMNAYVSMSRLRPEPRVSSRQDSCSIVQMRTAILDFRSATVRPGCRLEPFVDSPTLDVRSSGWVFPE